MTGKQLLQHAKSAAHQATVRRLGLNSEECLIVNEAPYQLSGRDYFVYDRRGSTAIFGERSQPRTSQIPSVPVTQSDADLLIPSANLLQQAMMSADIQPLDIQSTPLPAVENADGVVDLTIHVPTPPASHTDEVIENILPQLMEDFPGPYEATRFENISDAERVCNTPPLATPAPILEATMPFSLQLSSLHLQEMMSTMHTLGSGQSDILTEIRDLLKTQNEAISNLTMVMEKAQQEKERGATYRREKENDKSHRPLSESNRRHHSRPY